MLPLLHRLSILINDLSRKTEDRGQFFQEDKLARTLEMLRCLRRETTLGSQN